LIPVAPLTIIHFFAPIHGPTQDTKVLVVGTTFDGYPKGDIASQKEEWAYRENSLQKTILSFVTSAPDLIILPEDARYLSLYLSSLSSKNIDAFRTTFSKSLLVDGDTLLFGKTTRNYTLFYDIANDTRVGRGKTFLFPFSEYLPYLFEKIIGIFIGQQEASIYNNEHSYSRDTKMFMYPSKVGNIVTLVCSEVLSYDTLNRTAKEKPDIAILQSYLSVFHQNPLFYMSYNSFTKFAAAQIRAPLLVVAQDAPSMYISARGKVISEFQAPSRMSEGLLFTVDKK
jgi:apolipoprotein N-acyltransferase